MEVSTAHTIVKHDAWFAPLLSEGGESWCDRLGVGEVDWQKESVAGAILRLD